jgi:CRISPR-associated endonuclease/helicase Cas3
MSTVHSSEFEQFFFELHERKQRAFPWQIRLAAQVCNEGWPKVIDLPTASGKTACIDIALFALAVRGNDAPRRIFFVVDRRVIVSEAYKRAEKIKNALESSTGDVLKRVADRLRFLSGDDKRPLCAYELRGGAFRDETWVRSPLQPAVIASTVDQVGSRLLFRGYGVSENTWPVHAGLIANDSILFLDEAHCSRAFAQTLEAVERYRSETWAPKSLKRPFQFVEMSATPTRTVDSKERFTIDARDREEQTMRSRLMAYKPTQLAEPVKCRKDEFGKFAAPLIAEAQKLADDVGAKRVAIMVNRINTAKEVDRQLRKQQQDSTLVIGRMRPLDREMVEKRWEYLKSGASRDAQGTRRFIVSTQCLEVGADLDFDVVVSECASIDALQQRFGRLDRIGDFGSARGAVLVASWQLSGKDDDPVYGEALRETWNFLQRCQERGPVNFGIEGRGGQKSVAEYLAEEASEARSKLSLLGKDAPMLLPAHLDALVQTSPQPTPEPFIDYFLHGPERGSPDVYVAWRGDISDENWRDWAEIVRQCPPSSAEAMPVPLWTFRRWLQELPSKDESDNEIVAQTEREETDSAKQRLLVWNGAEGAFPTRLPSKIFPGAMVVLPSSAEGWDSFGFKPEDCRIDRGDEARLLLRRSICFRLHPNLIDEWEQFPNKDKLKALVSGEDADPDDIWESLKDAPEFEKFKPFFDKDDLNRYPVGSGWILETFYPSDKPRERREVLLEDHLKHVEEAVEYSTGDLLQPVLKRAVKAAAQSHDYGKADLRYQAWLPNGDIMAARYAPKPIAKSGKAILRKQTECGLPEDFRHELLSFVFAANSTELDPETRDLVLHLIASHHGRCRPFAPAAPDQNAECVQFAGATVCSKDIIEDPPFSLKWGIADRFWKLTRQHGWWGLTYLEAILRLADWKASDEEGTEVPE